ncbi:MAG: ThuA domain-containing protein [Candidatus Solibacter sp.]
MKTALIILLAVSPWVTAQELTPEQRQQIDAALPSKAPAKPKRARRILITSLCKRDNNVIRGHAAILHGAYALEQIGKRTGAYEAVFSNDIEMFRPGKLKEFDAVCFNNTQGVLWDDAELRKSLLDFVSSGHGLIAFHAGGVATFNQYPKYDFWPEFGKMIGGTDNGGHPWAPNDTFPVKVDDPKSKINAAFKGQGFQLTDEVFQVQENPLRDHMRVLLSVDMDKTQLPARNVLPVRRQDKDFPLTWIRHYGKGRVFNSGLGHNPGVFRNGPVLEHFLAAIQWTLGDLKADDKPSVKGPARP